MPNNQQLNRYRGNEFNNHGGVETIILTLPLLDVPAMKSHKGAEIMKPIACKQTWPGFSNGSISGSFCIWIAIFRSWKLWIMSHGSLEKWILIRRS